MWFSQSQCLWHGNRLSVYHCCTVDHTRSSESPTLSLAVPAVLQLAKAIGTYLDAHALGGVPQNSSQGLPKQKGLAQQAMLLVLNTNGLGDLEVPPFVATFPSFSSTFSLTGRIVPTAHHQDSDFTCSISRQVYSLQSFIISRPSDLFALVRRHPQYRQLQTQHRPKDTVIGTIFTCVLAFGV